MKCCAEISQASCVCASCGASSSITASLALPGIYKQTLWVWLWSLYSYQWAFLCISPNEIKGTIHVRKCLLWAWGREESKKPIAGPFGSGKWTLLVWTLQFSYWWWVVVVIACIMAVNRNSSWNQIHYAMIHNKRQILHQRAYTLNGMGDQGWEVKQRHGEVKWLSSSQWETWE